MYHYDKIPVERLLMSEPGLPGTILRYPIVYGPGDRQHRLFPYLKRMDDGRPAIVLSQGMAAWRCNRGYSEDMAKAVVLAITSEAAAGRIYNVAEPGSMTEAEWIGAIAKSAGWPGRVVTVPGEDLPEKLRDDMDTGQPLWADTTAIRADLGYLEEFTREEALRRTIEWERAHPPEKVDPEQYDYEAEDAVLRGR
jgi:nucleoside-diphosphate-sugar epimerase